MIRKSSFVVLCLCSLALANTVAITEFLNNADNEDSGREWVELYNYGADPVDIGGWTLADEDNDSITLPSAIIPSGGYIILANGAGDLSGAEAKQVFETEWLGGVADSRVIGIADFALGNGTDELILTDSSSVLSWSLAYANDESDNATFLTGTQPWSVNVYGSKAEPGVNREGLDVTGDLGYEDNSNTTDAFAFSGDISGLSALNALYVDVDEASIGSPLAGQYVAIPEPATLALIAMGAVALLRKK